MKGACWRLPLTVVPPSHGDWRFARAVLAQRVGCPWKMPSGRVRFASHGGGEAPSVLILQRANQPSAMDAGPCIVAAVQVDVDSDRPDSRVPFSTFRTSFPVHVCARARHAHPAHGPKGAAGGEGQRIEPMPEIAVLPRAPPCEVGLPIDAARAALARLAWRDAKEGQLQRSSDVPTGERSPKTAKGDWPGLGVDRRTAPIRA